MILTKSTFIKVALVLAGTLLLLVNIGSRFKTARAVSNGETWMMALENDIGDRTLRTLALLESHDAGTYSLNSSSPFPPAECQDVDPIKMFESHSTFIAGCVSYVDKIPIPDEVPDGLVDAVRALAAGTCSTDAVWTIAQSVAKSLVLPWSRTQNQTITQQLNAGLRSFDLRFCVEPGTGALRIHHGLLGATSDQILDQVETWVNTSGHEKEIVILDLHHLKNLNNTHVDNLVEDIRTRFPNELIPFSMKDTTLDEIWASQRNVVLAVNHGRYYDKDDKWNGPADIWEGKASNNYDKSVTDKETLLANARAIMSSLNSDDWNYILQGQLTPNNDHIVNGTMYQMVQNLKSSLGDCILIPGTDVTPPVYNPICLLAKDLLDEAVPPSVTSTYQLTVGSSGYVADGLYSDAAACQNKVRANLNKLWSDFATEGTALETLYRFNEGDFNSVPSWQSRPNLSILEGNLFTLNRSFTDQDWCDRITATASWGDSSNQDEQLHPPPAASGQEVRNLGFDHTYLDNGSYTITTCVEDYYDEACDSWSVEVANVPPQITAEGSTIDENGVATVNGTITDPGILDNFTMVIDWGEGIPVNYQYVAGTTVYTQTHQYLDDNPTGTPQDTYTITLKITDKDGGEGTTTSTVTVVNLSPIAQVPEIRDEANQVVGVQIPYGILDSELYLSSAFSDVGTQDTHAAIVNWDDGIINNLGGVTGVVTDSHVYTQNGTYEIEVTLADDDTGQDKPARQVVILSVAEVLAELQNLLEANSNDPQVAAAIEKIYGHADGNASDGAFSMYEKDNLIVALEKLAQAIFELENADPSLDMETEKNLMALIAKSISATALREAEEANPNPSRAKLRKLSDASGLIDEGTDLIYPSQNYVEAVLKFKDAVQMLSGTQ